MATAKDILALAASQIGITENPPDSNRVKYNTWWYGHEVSGSAYPWCCAFVNWLFDQIQARKLFYGGGKTASSGTLYNYHKAQGQAVTSYQPGDIIFFNFSGGRAPQHVGVCEAFDGTHITTIDGNTGTTNEANGGAVMRRRRHKSFIVGAYRPDYEKEEEDMPFTYDEFKAFYARLKTEEAAMPASPVHAQDVGLAKQNGLMEETRPQNPLKREELATVLQRFEKRMKEILNGGK